MLVVFLKIVYKCLIFVLTFICCPLLTYYWKLHLSQKNACTRLTVRSVSQYLKPEKNKESQTIVLVFQEWKKKYFSWKMHLPDQTSCAPLPWNVGKRFLTKIMVPLSVELYCLATSYFLLLSAFTAYVCP